jgi:DNA repair protein RecN (Recombination protein N)
MLTELRIRNFALIDKLSVRLGPGLNVLTGETGAGKSIVVGALSLLLGERASSEVVRSGEDRASIEGVFEVDGREDLAKLLDERGIDAGDGVIVLKREVAAGGRSRAWVNGSPATAGLLGEIGRMLVDLHGQHEHQTLLRRDEQRAILDAYAGNAALLAQVRAAHNAAAELRREVGDLERRRRDALQRADFLRFQADEIEKAALKPGEEDALEDEARRLSHSEELTALSAQLYDALAGADGSVVESLGGLGRTLDHLTRIDPAQEPSRELYDTAYYALQELGERMERYAQTVEHDPARLDEIRRRQDVVFRLRTKYGGTVEEVVEIGRTAREELDLIDGADFELGALQKRLSAATAELERLSAELTARRMDAAARLAEEVNAVLPDLGMAGGRFELARLPVPEPGAFGAEDVEFRVSLNRGFEPRALSFVASGGEMSRIMLALKTILARLDAVPTLVFDEVDAGIGGRVALQVGEKMREVAAGHQVFAITHLPQIASRANVHLRVSKHDRPDGKTATEVTALGDDERVREIARMLGGDPESAVSLEHARELLERGVAVS